MKLKNEQMNGLRLLKMKITVDNQKFELDFREISDVTIQALNDDLKTRDFSCNCIYYDFLNRRIYDNFNSMGNYGLDSENKIQGYKDIKEGVLRWNPEINLGIFEDATRYLRAIRLMNKCKFKLAYVLECEIKDNGKNNIKKYDKNLRIIMELNKMMKNDKLVYQNIESLFKFDIIVGIFKGIKLKENIRMKEIREKLKLFLKLQGKLMKMDYEDKRMFITLKYMKHSLRVLMLLMILQEKTGIENTMKNIKNSKYLFVSQI